ncbi:hypothetical protein P7C70_g3519, partial [Phenoliferia sp. Uapishka_3]
MSPSPLLPSYANAAQYTPSSPSFRDQYSPSLYSSTPSSSAFFLSSPSPSSSAFPSPALSGKFGPFSPAPAPPAQGTHLLRQLYKTRLVVVSLVLVGVAVVGLVTGKATGSGGAVAGVKAKVGGWGAWSWDKVENGQLGIFGEAESKEASEHDDVMSKPAGNSEELTPVAAVGTKKLKNESNSGQTDTKESEDAIDRTGATIAIKALPLPHRPLADDEGVKYIGFLPHSGFHNQRIALQNAFLLGTILNRTVLVPPVWIGWPVAERFYDRLQAAWTDNVLTSPHSFGLDPPAPNSPLNFPGPYPSDFHQHPEYNSTDIDRILAEREAERLRVYKFEEAKWAKKGFKVRPDGVPITNLTADDCKSYGAECRHTYKDTFIAWDFLVDLEKVKQEVPVVDRWDMRERVIEELLNIEPNDVYVLRDRHHYDFQFVHSGTETSPLVLTMGPESRWRRHVQLPALSALPQKVLLLGSLFSSDRIHLPASRVTAELDLRSFFSRAMAFRSPWLIKPADTIRDMLGGTTGYVGVHARIADGDFRRAADENMEGAWASVVRRLHVKEIVRDEMWAKVGWKKGKHHRPRSEVVFRKEVETSDWSELDDGFDEYATGSDNNEGDVDFPLLATTKRADIQAPHSIPPPALTKLQCRSPLHTEPDLLPFNTPIYLATDSRSPTTDAFLVPFFSAFPCTFILSDFDRPSELNYGIPVDSVGDMLKLVNKLDGVALGRLLLPFMEAVVASKGFTTVGTPGSTFSGYAAGDLHQAYLLDEKEEERERALD